MQPCFYRHRCAFVRASAARYPSQTSTMPCHTMPCVRVPLSARLRADRATTSNGSGSADPQARIIDHSGMHWAMCLLCKDEQRNTVLKPCNHICLCQECGQPHTTQRVQRMHLAAICAAGSYKQIHDETTNPASKRSFEGSESGMWHGDSIQ